MKHIAYLVVASLLALGTASCGVEEPSRFTGDLDPTLDMGPTSDVPESTQTDGLTVDPSGETTIDDRFCVERDEECAAGQVARGCGCVDPVGFDGYRFSGVYSYVNRIQLPTTDARCCFDLPGSTFSGAIDNVLADLLMLLRDFLDDDFSFQDTLDEALEEDAFALILEYRRLPIGLANTGWDDFFGISVFLGTNTDEGAEAPRQTAPERANGEGVFRVFDDSLDRYGALVQFNNATLLDGEIEAGPAQFLFSIEALAGDLLADFLGEGESLLDGPLVIEDALLRATVEETARGVATVQEAIGGTVFGGARLGGAIPIDQIIDAVDNLARPCACAGIDPNFPVLIGGEDIERGFYEIECNEGEQAFVAEGDDTCDDEIDGAFCGFVTQICDFTGVFGNLVDVDTTGSGVPDSLSMGLFLTMVGADLAAEPIAISAD